MTNRNFEATLSVNAEGMPTRCDIFSSSGNAAVDARACAVFVKRTRYTRRTDVFGDPVADRMFVFMNLNAMN